MVPGRQAEARISALHVIAFGAKEKRRLQTARCATRTRRMHLRSQIAISNRWLDPPPLAVWAKWLIGPTRRFHCS